MYICIYTCIHIGDMKLWNLCPCVEHKGDDDELLNLDLRINWEQYKTIQYQLADGSNKTKRDFVKEQTTFETFEDHFRSYFKQYLEHHDLAKHQESKIKFLRGSESNLKPNPNPNPKPNPNPNPNCDTNL